MKLDIISQEISQRVFMAIDKLTNEGKLNGVSEFASKYNINLRLLYFQKNEPERRIVRLSWLSYLVNDYKISAHWLITGVGNFYGDAVVISQKRAKAVQEIKHLADTLL